MPASVADISEARCTWLGWRYLSITARSVPSSSLAAVAKVRRALASGAMRSRTASAHTGSSPVSSACVAPLADAGAPKAASGWLASRLRPSQRWRSVCTRMPSTCASLSARKCACAARLRWAAAACARTTGPAGPAATRRARTGSMKAGWASSARASDSVTSKADISSISSVRSPRLLQLDLAELDVVFRADPHRGVCLHAGPGGVEADAVGVEAAAVVRRRVGRRMLRDRHRMAGHPCARCRPAQVEEAAMRVAQRVVAPARDAGAAPAAPAGAVGAQRHAVAAVGQQVRRLQRGCAGKHLAQQARSAAFAHQHRRSGRGARAAARPRAAHVRAAARPPPRWQRWPCPSAARRRPAARWPAPRCSCPGGAP